MLVVTSCSLILLSCNKHNNTDRTQQSDSELAIEIISKKQVETSNQFISENEYADFINPEISQLMSKSKAYLSYRGAANTKSATDVNPVYYAEQIPVFEDVSEQTKIFFNGEQESVYESNIDPEGNPILLFHDTPADLEQYIAKVEVKNGYRNCYSPSGELLSSEPSVAPNMKEYVQEVQKYMEMAEQEAATRSTTKRDIEWLRQKMASQPMTKGDEVPYYKIEQLSNGNVVLEQEMYINDNSTSTRGNIETGRILIRTELSPDVSRTMGFELKKDNILLERRKYTYSESNTKTKSTYTPEAEGPDMNPEQIITERLVLMPDGTPMISVKNENFSQNQTIYHFNKKK